MRFWFHFAFKNHALHRSSVRMSEIKMRRFRLNNSYLIGPSKSSILLRIINDLNSMRIRALFGWDSILAASIRQNLFIAKTGDNILELKINHFRFGNPVGPRELEIIILQRNSWLKDSSIPQNSQVDSWFNMNQMDYLKKLWIWSSHIFRQF